MNELAHLEMVGTIVHQLTKNASIEEIEKSGLSAYYTDHGVDVYPQSAAGVPFTAAYIACKGDPIANLQEDLAADGTTLQEQVYRKNQLHHALFELFKIYIIFSKVVQAFSHGTMLLKHIYVEIKRLT